MLCAVIQTRSTASMRQISGCNLFYSREAHLQRVLHMWSRQNMP
jgi:hypothetical protein